MIIGYEHLGKLATLSSGETVKLIDFNEAIECLDLDGNYKICYYDEIEILWES